MKAFIKPFEAPQRSVKIKNCVNFLSSSGIGTGRVMMRLVIDPDCRGFLRSTWTGKIINWRLILYLLFASKTYFSNIVASLNIPSVNNYITEKESANKYSKQIKCFETHPSIATITKPFLSSSFNFQKTNANEVMKIISQLNTAKTCQNADTPTKIIKLNKYIFAKFISNNSHH